MCKCGHMAVWHFMWIGRCEVHMKFENCNCQKYEDE